MNLRQTPECLYLDPVLPATAALIWLHGLGADGFDFLPIAAELKLPESVRFVFPHAPIRPITLNGGIPMRGWYDILSLDRDGAQDETGIRASAARVERLIADETAAGLVDERIVLAGFSQGGAVVLHTALRHPRRLCGLLALSTYLPLAGQLAAEAAAANRRLPILMCHGRFDPVLPMQLGEASRDALQALGYPVQWMSYPMQHEVCLAQLSMIGNWLRERLTG